MRRPNRSLEFLRRISRPRHPRPGGADSISVYVEERAALLTSEELEELRPNLGMLTLQFTTIAAPEFPHLQAQLKFLAEFLEDTGEGLFPTASEASRKEAAFAIRYAAKEADIIPDFIPEIGYADDSLIVRTVLNRHRDVFCDYCRFRDIAWSEISLLP